MLNQFNAFCRRMERIVRGATTAELEVLQFLVEVELRERDEIERLLKNEKI